MCLFLGYKADFPWNCSYCGCPYDITQPKLSYHAGKKERETILVWYSFFWMKMDKIMVKIQSEYIHTVYYTDKDQSESMVNEHNHKNGTFNIKCNFYLQQCNWI